MVARSVISKRTWRERKREGGKAVCSFCRDAIFAGGVRYKGKPWHKSCLESMKFGLTRMQAGVANPKAKCPTCGRFMIYDAGKTRPYFCYRCDTDYFPTEVKEFNPRLRPRNSYRFYGAKALNPGAAWHEQKYRESVKLPQSGWNSGFEYAHMNSLLESRKEGILNPTRRQSKLFGLPILPLVAIGGLFWWLSRRK